MTAIVTSKFRTTNGGNFKRDISDVNNSVYIFIAKSDAWSDSIDVLTDGEPPIPLDTLRDEKEVHQNIMAAKIITAADVTHVIPRYNWVLGHPHSAWDDRDPDIFTKQFYVLTDESKVFKCLKAGPSNSIIKPTLAQVVPFELGDGYTWKYMYTLAANDATKYLTNFYIPIKTVISANGDGSDLSESDFAQWTNQNLSISGLNGKIYDIKITEGGTGYNPAPTITIVGNGTGATATCTVSNGSIDTITITNSGSGYTMATCTFSGGGGSGAAGYPVTSPGLAHGTDPISELGGYFIAVHARLEYEDGGGDFIVDNSFRQVGLIRNPLNSNGDAVTTASTINCLDTLVFQNGTDWVVGDVIVGASSGAKAYVDYVDISKILLKIHQNDKTGYGTFLPNETINGIIGGSGVSALADVYTPAEYTRGSGEIIFLENRTPINRVDSQIEDVKIIIEF